MKKISQNIDVTILPNSNDYLDNLRKYEFEVESFWSNESKNKKVHNGKILSVVSLVVKGGDISLKCSFVDYKSYYFQKKCGKNLKIIPISVSGITYYSVGKGKNVLIGKRSMDVTLYPGFFELVPSGTIDDRMLDDEVDNIFIKQIIAELEEEAQISGANIKCSRIVSLLYDKQENIYDVGVSIELHGSVDHPQKTKEYDEMKFIPLKEIEKILKSDKIVPTSRDLYKEWLEKEDDCA
jgi:predicted NUDIX family phosphoesterase